MHASDIRPVECFNTLIGYNNNRVECYGLAIKQSRSSMLSALFERLVETSLFCNQELIREVYKLGGVPLRGTMAESSHFTAWHQLQLAAERSSNKEMVNACLAAECFTVIAVSRTALRYAAFLNMQQTDMLRRQLDMSRRDLHTVNNTCRVFTPVEVSGVNVAHAVAVQTRINVIEPLKNAGRRIIAAFATGASNFGPSIR